MKTVGVICEYNPFHNGHAEQLAKLREQYPSHALVCVMSGNFVQRGEYAIFDKYTRAGAAISEGADLVLELPYPFSASGAEQFARAGVSILHALGVDALAFGSESGDLATLQQVAKRLESAEFSEMLEAEREKGGTESYVRLCQRLYHSIWGEGFPTKPNDILAVCYLRAIQTLGAEIEPYTYARTSSFSATEAREALREGNQEAMERLIPERARTVFAGHMPISPLAPSATLLPFFRLYRGDVESLCEIDGMSPGLPSRMRRAAMESTDSEQMLARLTSKRDTAAKIRRSMLACLTGTTRRLPLTTPAYTAVLAANTVGCRVLAMWRRSAGIPILTKPSRGENLTGDGLEQYTIALRAEYLYAQAMGVSADTMLKQRPWIPKNESENPG